MKILKVQLACGLMLAFIVGCSQENTSEAVLNTDNAKARIAADLPNSSDYQKPGASVRFSHNFDGRLEPNQSQTVSMVFTEAYDAGSLSLSFTADEGLEYSPLQTQLFALQSASEHSVDISLSAQNSGRYYLRIFVEVMLPEGRSERRVFGLAVDVGNGAGKSEEAGESMAKDFRGEELILLPAKENHKE